MRVTTRWVLGRGPCGPDCNIKDIGRSTLSSRKQQEALYSDSFYFGNFTITQTQGSVRFVDVLNDVMATTVSESLVGMDDVERWEEESMFFSFLVPHTLTDAAQVIQ